MKPPQPIEHKHKFVIPVQWKYADGTLMATRHDAALHCIVTKLRCECGEEIDR